MRVFTCRRGGQSSVALVGRAMVLAVQHKVKSGSPIWLHASGCKPDTQLNYKGLIVLYSPSRQSSATTPVQYDFDDVYRGYLDNDWDVNANGGGGTASGRCKELPSKFDRCRLFLTESDKLKVPSALNGLLARLIVGARTDMSRSATPSNDKATPCVTVPRTHIALLERQLLGGDKKLKVRGSRGPRAKTSWSTLWC